MTSLVQSAQSLLKIVRSLAIVAAIASENVAMVIKTCETRV